MTTTSALDRDAEFEAELRAMLERRAADVQPERLDVRAAPAGSPRLIAHLDRQQDHASGHRFARVAAALVLMAGAAGAMALATRQGTTTETDAGTTGGPAVAIWPRDTHVPLEQLATPESAAQAYLSEVADVGPEFPLEQTVIEGTQATVHYTLEGTAATVSLTQREGRWYVASAANELVVIASVSAPEDQKVWVDVEPGSRGGAVERLRARLIDRNGEPYDTANVEFEHGEPVRRSDPPLADGSWRTYLFVGETTEPVAVRVDVLSSNADTDAVRAHATAAVPGAPELSDPAPATTTTRPLTVDPDPEPLPAVPDRLTPLSLADGRVDGAVPDRLSLAGWEAAATELLNTARDDTAPPGPPTFTDESLDPDELTVSGRYSMPDGDTGGFELIRLEDGGWGMTSLLSDHLEIRDVGRSGSRVQVILVSAKDADLGVGGNRAGWEPGEPFVIAEQEAVFSVPCRDSVATMFQFFDAHDGTNLRIAEAWPC
jgi:hypothetical protein